MLPIVIIDTNTQLTACAHSTVRLLWIDEGVDAVPIITFT